MSEGTPEPSIGLTLTPQLPPEPTCLLGKSHCQDQNVEWIGQKPETGNGLMRSEDDNCGESREVASRMLGY